MSGIMRLKQDFFINKKSWRLKW